MEPCIEVAVFKVKPEEIGKAIELSKSIFEEMNAKEKVIVSYNILQKTDAPGELAWHMTWTSADAAKNTTAQWPTFPSTKAFQSLVIEDLYYGHFLIAEHQ